MTDEEILKDWMEYIERTQGNKTNYGFSVKRASIISFVKEQIKKSKQDGYEEGFADGISAKNKAIHSKKLKKLKLRCDGVKGEK